VTTRLPALCWACERRTEGERARCEAFPDGIPFEIIALAGDHREPVDGDHGRQFVQAETDAARTAFADWEAFDAARAPRSEEPDDEEARRLDDGSLRLRGIIGETRLAGKDVTPGHDQLHHYWTRGEGLTKWKFSPKPWTTLVALLTEHVGPEKAKVFASRWFIEVFGYAAGSDKNRVAHGHPPRGDRVGPG